MKLNADTLTKLDPRIVVPSYDRSQLKPGILHVGLGNFHRAHQAFYANQLLNAGGSLDWGILGAGVMPTDAAMRADLEAQDWLYSVTKQGAGTEEVEVSGVMCGFLPVEEGHGPIIEAMQNPDVRIVSLTVTEGGYYVSAETGGFNPEAPDIRADIASPDKPKTVFGAIVAGLKARRDAGQVPFTVMSCDNLPHNGNVTRSAVVGVARGQDSALADWIDANVAFPNAMVDRITPATTSERAAGLAEEYGLEDARPVFCEPFLQWVLEDKFTAGRPAFEEVGVQIVEDVTPYEHMKIRMLNGGHAIIAYPSALLGLTYAHEAMAHPLVSAFFDKVEREEIYNVVEAVPGATQPEYHAALQERFANPAIRDTIARLCFDGSNRQPKFIVPSVAENLAQGRSVPGLALESALWCRYCFGEGEQHQEIPANDPSWDRLTGLAREARDRPDAWLEMRDIYGDLVDKPDFRDAFAAALESLWNKGCEATLKAYLGL
ncbi:mannitol dehydrogenase family protein [Aliiruegeria sabulilitoris]|uniref:mannitol dehydrogenase family protein n=1 Tax=Aliiruegeria sabulilitoris TaxID=1510458 RepID=UPI0008370B53|nr:mannitol dehydrogenase family protein [Aliiruegeria sabulilitoris]NDR57829.1 mannitol dehydrogenase family protein [Pseudoruegeria sp. M32A2M]